MSREVVALRGGEPDWHRRSTGSDVDLSISPVHPPEVLLPHAKATLTPITRLRLARLVVEPEWTPAAAAMMSVV
jgi:hypothetical protein